MDTVLPPDLAQFDAFLDRLLAVPLLGTARLSPDGRWVAWLWSGLADTRQLWLVPADASVSPRCIVGDDWDCDTFHWAPDSHSIVYGRSRDGDERVGLHQLFLDGRPSRALTEDRPDYYIRGGQLAKDGRALIYAANVDPRSGKPIESGPIYRHDIVTGERRVIAHPERAVTDEAMPRLSSDDRHILYLRSDRDPAGSQLWLTDIDGSFDREIVNVGDRAKVWGLWSPDGSAIVVTAEAGDHRRIGLWRLVDAVVDWLIDDPRRSLSSAFWPSRSPDLVVEEARNARTSHTLLDPDSRREQPFPTADGTAVPIGVAADGAWIARHYGARHPLRLVRLAAGDRPLTLQPLSTLSTGAVPSPQELLPAEDLRWRSVDGMEIQGWLYRAAGTARGTILHIHGGPTWHYEDEFLPLPQYFARAGFNVLQPNYRGSTGFGLAFEEAIKAQGWGGLEQDDILTGADALVQAGIAEPGRIGITGVSYGGYSSWWAITHAPPERIAAAAPICGMTDLVVDYDTCRPDLRPYVEEMMGGSPKQIPQRFFERSPINFVDNIRGRLLIVQGLNDPNVTPIQVDIVRERLDRVGIDYEVLTFADEGHGVAKPANRRILLRRLAAFFAAAFA